jgi:hypothetical protein
MDELDLLREKWQSREQELPSLSYKDIYSMLLKKSSSVVKWIFLISVIELAFWIGISFLLPESGQEFYADMGMKNVMIVFTIFSYAIIVIFIYLFYKNYTAIKVTDTAKDLMQSILKTRRTVRYFVIYNVGATALTLLIFNIYFFFEKDKLSNILSNTEGYNTLPPEQITTAFFLGQIIVGVIMIGLLILIYWLIYGMLLKRLNRNYNELKKIEI